MGSRTMYITSVRHTLRDHWAWTKPCGSPLKSIKSAQNMICARLLDEKGISRDFPNFGMTLSLKMPEIVKEAQQYIGETREVTLCDGERPKDFQRKFHDVQYFEEEE
tara:strand:+ start:374 stop:694 length:321 start_codon:yes stop_codon:yes gene_type:complete